MGDVRRDADGRDRGRDAGRYRPLRGMGRETPASGSSNSDNGRDGRHGRYEVAPRGDTISKENMLHICWTPHDTARTRTHRGTGVISSIPSIPSIAHQYWSCCHSTPGCAEHVPRPMFSPASHIAEDIVALHTQPETRGVSAQTTEHVARPALPFFFFN